MKTTQSPSETIGNELQQKSAASNANTYPRPASLRGRIHVLFLIDELCEMGGAERALLNTIRLLPKDRFECSLITFRNDPSLSIFTRFPCRYEVLPLRKTYDWNALKVARRIRSRIRGEQVSIVHTFFETSDLWGALIARLSGCPIVVSSRRDMGILRRRKHDLAYPMLNILFDRVIAVSEQVRQFCIRKDGLDSSKVVTIYNGIGTQNVALEEIDILFDHADHGTANGMVVTLGHIRKVKGIDVFIRACEIVRKEFPRVQFLVVGDVTETDHAQELRNLTTSLGLDENVKFVGNREDVFRVLKSCDIFCLLSRSEGFSNALIEAMSVGLPCVATRVGGNEEAIAEGKSGFLVENEDIQGAAERILRLLRDPLLAKEMGAAGQAIVEAKFTAQAMITQLVKVYESLLDAKRR